MEKHVIVRLCEKFPDSIHYKASYLEAMLIIMCRQIPAVKEYLEKEIEYYPKQETTS